MAPSPIAIPRQHHGVAQPGSGAGKEKTGPTLTILLTSCVVLLATTLPWARRWCYSGASVESLLLVYGSSNATQLFPSVPLWTLLASINLIYAVSSTSWLLYGLFTAACYPFVLLTCLFQFQAVSDFTRRRLRKVLRELHFTRDRVALFNMPALEIDTDVSGLFVARGITISLSSLRIIAHGLELGLKLSEDMELALYVDEVDIQLFRRIIVGEVYGNLKGGKAEMTFSDLETVDTEDDAVFQADSAFLRKAHTGLSDGGRLAVPMRPTITRDMTGGSFIQDSSLRESLGATTSVSADNSNAEAQYDDMIEHIKTSSHVYGARNQVEKDHSESAFAPKDEKDMRAAICAKLQDMPSVPHPPTRSIRVTTLQNLSPPYVRDFLHRLPFLLRLLLMPLSYFHPLSFSSITAAGSGTWLTALLQEHIFKSYATQDAQIKRLERKISQWLASASFCVQLTDIAGLGQVALSSAYDIVTYLQFADIMVYRTALNTGDIRQVARLGGADATVTVPSFLLPHHEHLLPPKPTSSDLKDQADAAVEADGTPKTVQAENDLQKMKADQTEVTMSVHASLPACFDQSLLNFVAALVKATKVIELEKTMESESEAEEEPPQHQQPLSPLSPTLSHDTTTTSTTSPTISRAGTNFKNFTQNIRQNIKDGKTSASMKSFARDLQQQTRDGMKKAVVGGMINDRWIAKLVGKIAAKLEQAQGDLGYSGAIPLPLGPYRPPEGLASKLLP